MNRGVSTSLEASSATVIMDTTKMKTFLTSALILMSAWKADLTVTSVLICREGEKLNSIYIRWRTPYQYRSISRSTVTNTKFQTSGSTLRVSKKGSILKQYLYTKSGFYTKIFRGTPDKFRANPRELFSRGQKFRRILRTPEGLAKT